jgi:hypothetical protein
MAHMVETHDGWVLRDDWHVEDVECRLEDYWGFELTEKECIEVLELVARSFDANDGVNWDAIDAAIEALFGDRKKEKEERKWVGTIRMREDLIEEELAVPASFTFENYDTMVNPIFIDAEELEGATQGNDPRGSEDHAFCYVELKDGRSMYFLSVDLDFKDEEKDA